MVLRRLWKCPEVWRQGRMGMTPSVTLGVGYNLTAKKGTQNMIWIRPKIYWNLAFTSLDTPYAQVQFGFTKNFK